MNPPLLELKRLWRDVQVAPDATVHDLLDVLADRDDQASIERYGFHTTESLARHACLFLLGRPGAGKSAEIERLKSGEVSGFSGERLVVVACKETGADLHPTIDRRLARVEASNTQPVRLVIDGLDEGFLRDGTFFSRLKSILSDVRADHPTLRLLLACRPEWDKGFDESVHAMWRGEGKPAVFVLEPLSSKARRALVEGRGVKDADGFFRWVQRNNFEEFAAWPRSLEWLADEFLAGRAEKLNYIDLCRRRVARGFGEDKRYAEAGHAGRAEVWTQAVMLVGAALVFCGRKGIALDAPADDCLTLDEIFSTMGALQIPGRPSLDRETVREAVRQASHLMEKADGHHRFQNQSDLEFLAAAMLADFKREQLAELFGCPDDSGRWCVFPQLASTAAMLATQSPDFFDLLIERDPRVLMRMDFAAKLDDARREAVDAMLTATALAESTGGHDAQALFPTLRHAVIAAQLRPWLFDSKRSLVSRELAYDIARECCGAEVALEVERAASSGDELAREHLALWIRLFSQSWSEEKVCEWARGENDDLAGAALDALLDRGRKPRDLAPFLRRSVPHRLGLLQFHHQRLARECQAEDVPVLLPILAQWPGVGDQHSGTGRIVSSLVAKGIAALDKPDVREAVTSFLIARAKRRDFMLHGFDAKALAPLGLDDTTHRRALILALAEKWPADADERLLPQNCPLLLEDHEWLLDCVASATGLAATALADLAACIAWRCDERLRESLDRAHSASAPLRERLPQADAGGIFATLQRLRREADERSRIKMAEFEAANPQFRYDHAEYFAQALEACRAGRLGYWVELCYALSQPRNEVHSSDFYRRTDVRQLAGWAAGSDELRAELIHIARQYLLTVRIPPPEPKTIPNAYFGITYALSLHAPRLNEDAELRAAIDPSWVLALLHHCGSEDGPLAQPLAILATLAPEKVAEACRREFRERWEQNETIFGQLLPAAWSPETETALIEVLRGMPLQPKTYLSGLDFLAQRQSPRAAEVAAGRLSEHSSQPDSPARRAAIAGCIFICFDLWERAWPHLAADRSAARRFLLEYGRWIDYHDREQRLERMPTPLLAALYGLAIDCFPVKDAPHHEGPYSPAALDDAYHLRGLLQRTLEARGAKDALAAVYRHADETRKAWWARASLDRAHATAHAQRRAAPDAAEFIRFLATEGGTFVRDNDSLQRAVLTSLRRFEGTLHPNHIVRLWDKGQPRDEEKLQIEIADHLAHDLKRIVVNMETKVELRERADIRVQADSYVVTVEVKLGHSDDRDRPLRTAMRSQLRAYLQKQNETHGIYVVGWFFCPAFRPAALRDLKTPRASQKHFDTQARKLSTNGFVLAASVIDCRWLESTASRARRLKAARHSH